MCFHITCLAFGGLHNLCIFLEKFLDQRVDGVILQEELWKCRSYGKYECPFYTFGKGQTGYALLGVN
jgi:hypothetical protein